MKKVYYITIEGVTLAPSFFYTNKKQAEAIARERTTKCEKGYKWIVETIWNVYK